MGPGLVYLSQPNKEKHTFTGKGKNLEFAATGMQGWRKTMEDAHCAITGFDGDPSACLFGVFDGHGGTFVLLYSPIGREVAEYTARHLPEVLLSNSYYSAGNYKEALRTTFLIIDSMLSTEGGRNEISKLSESIETCSMSPTKNGTISGLTEDGPEMKGCTANVILIKGGNIYVANAGDSRAVLAKKRKAVELSKDHKPDDEVEAIRIGKAGGYIVEGRVNGNLNLSRALGDLRYKEDKKLKPEEQIISGEPDVVMVPLTEEVDFIVMGCDGVYETKTSQEIVDFFYTEFAKNKNEIAPAVEKLLDTVCSPDCIQTDGAGCDNMTCIVIKFTH